MLPWNRKEVYTGTSMTDFSRVRNLLSEAGIRCDIRMVNHSRGNWDTARAPAPNFGNPDYATQYYVYVAKPDEEKAKHLILKNRTP